MLLAHKPDCAAWGNCREHLTYHLSRHVCYEPHFATPVRVAFRTPYSGARIPGLSWDLGKRARTLARLSRHTRIVDDLGNANNLWDRPTPVFLEEIGALALLAALRPRILRAPAVDCNGRTCTGWAEAVRTVTRNRLGVPAPTGDTFPRDLDENNPLHWVIANTRADRNMPGERVLLPATTTILFTTISEDNNPLFPAYALAPSTERAIVNVRFTDTAAAPFGAQEPRFDFPRRLTHLVVLIATPPADYTWTWGGRRPHQVGVLQTLKDVTRPNMYGSRLHTVTLVGVERIDPVYYNAVDVDASSTWEARKEELGRLLTELPVSPWLAPTTPMWRLTTFDEWRAEVGEELYALATVAPWDKWPDGLLHGRP